MLRILCTCISGGGLHKTFTQKRLGHVLKWKPKTAYLRLLKASQEQEKLRTKPVMLPLLSWQKDQTKYYLMN